MAERIALTFDLKVNTQAAKRLSEVEAELLDINKQLREARKLGQSDLYGNLRVQQSALKNEAVQLRSVVRSQLKDFRDAKFPTDSLIGLRKAYRGLVSEINQLSAAERRSDLGRNLIKQADQVKTKIDNVNLSIRNFSANVGNYSSAFNGLGNAFKQALPFATLAAGFAAVSRGIVDATKVTADFERQIKTLGVITGAVFNDPQGLAGLEAQAAELGRTTEFTASQVAQLQIAYGRVGFSTAEIDAATQSTLDLATVTGEDLPKSASIVAATLGGYGLEAEETKRVTDVMAASFNSTRLQLDSFAESTKLVAPVARLLNIPIEDATATIGALADAGLEGTVSGTALRRVFSELANENSKLSQRLGVTVNDADSFREALIKLGEANIGASEAIDLVGRNAFSAFAVLSQNTDQVLELGQSFRNIEIGAAEGAAAIRDTLQGSLDSLRSAIEGAQIAFVQFFGPIIKGAVDNLTNLFRLFVQFLEVLKELPQFLRQNADLIGALAVGLITLNANLIAASANLLRLNAVAVVTAARTRALAIAQGILNFALKDNPVGFFITLLSALALAFRTAYNRSEEFRAIVAGLGGILREVGEIVKEVVTGFVSAFNNLREGNFGAALKDVGKIIVENNPLTVAFTQGARLKQAFEDGYDDQKAEEKIKAEAAAVAEEMANLGEKGGDAAKQAGLKTGNSLGEGLTDGLDATIAILQKKKAEIQDELEDAIEGSAEFERLSNELADVNDALAKATKEDAEATKDAVKNARSFVEGSVAAMQAKVQELRKQITEGDAGDQNEIRDKLVEIVRLEGEIETVTDKIQKLEDELRQVEAPTDVAPTLEDMRQRLQRLNQELQRTDLTDQGAIRKRLLEIVELEGKIREGEEALKDFKEQLENLEVPNDAEESLTNLRIEAERLREEITSESGGNALLEKVDEIVRLESRVRLATASVRGLKGEIGNIPVDAEGGETVEDLRSKIEALKVEIQEGTGDDSPISDKLQKIIDLETDIRTGEEAIISFKAELSTIEAPAEGEASIQRLREQVEALRSSFTAGFDSELTAKVNELIRLEGDLERGQRVIEGYGGSLQDLSTPPEIAGDISVITARVQALREELAAEGVDETALSSQIGLIVSLESGIRQGEAALNSYSEELSNIKAPTGLEGDLEALQERSEALRASIEDAGEGNAVGQKLEELIALQEDLRNTTGTVEGLKGELSDVELNDGAAASVQELQDRIESLVGEISTIGGIEDLGIREQVTEFLGLENQIDLQSSALQRFQDSIESIQVPSEAVEGLQAIKAEAQALREEISSDAGQQNAVKEKVEEIIQLEGQIKQIEGAVSSFKESLVGVQVPVQAEEELTALRERVTELRSEIRAAGADPNEIEEKLNALIGVEGRIKEGTEAIAAFNRELTSIAAPVDVAATLEDLKEKSEALRKEVEEGSGTDANVVREKIEEIVDVQRRLKEGEEALAAYKTSLGSIEVPEDAVKGLLELRKRAQELKGELVASGGDESQISQQIDRIIELEGEIRQNTEALDQFNIALDATANQTDITTALDQVRAAAASLRRELETSASGDATLVGDKLDEIVELEGKIKEAEAAVGTFNNSLGTVEIPADATASIQEMKSRVEELKAELSEGADGNAVREKIDDLIGIEADLESSSAAVQAFDRQLNGLTVPSEIRGQLAELKEESESLLSVFTQSTGTDANVIADKVQQLVEQENELRQAEAALESYKNALGTVQAPEEAVQGIEVLRQSTAELREELEGAAAGDPVAVKQINQIIDLGAELEASQGVYEDYQRALESVQVPAASVQSFQALQGASNSLGISLNGLSADSTAALMQLKEQIEEVKASIAEDAGTDVNAIAGKLEEIISLEAQIAEVEAAVGTFNENLGAVVLPADAAASVEEMRSRVEELKTELSEGDNENVIRAKLDNLVGLESELQTSKDAVAEFDRQLNGLTVPSQIAAQLEDLKEKSEGLLASFSESTGTDANAIAAKVEEIVSLEAQIEQSEAAIESYKAALGTVEAPEGAVEGIELLRDRTEALRAELEGAAAGDPVAARQLEQIIGLEGELRNSQEAIESYQGALQGVQVPAASLNSLQQLEQRAESLKNSLINASGLEGNVAAQKIEEILALQADLANSEASLKQLKDSLGTVEIPEAATASIERTRDKIEELKTELSKGGDATQIKRQLDELVSVNTELDEATAAVSRFGLQLAGVQAPEEVPAILSQIRLEANALRQEFEAEGENKILAQIDELVQVEADLAAAKAAIEEFSSSLGNVEPPEAALQAIQELETKAADLRAEIDLGAGSDTDLSQKIERLIGLEGDLIRGEQVIERYREALTGVGTIDFSDQSIAELRNRVSELNKELTTEVADENALADKIREIIALEDEIGRREGQIAALRKELEAEAPVTPERQLEIDNADIELRKQQQIAAAIETARTEEQLQEQIKAIELQADVEVLQSKLRNSELEAAQRLAIENELAQKTVELDQQVAARRKAITQEVLNQALQTGQQIASNLIGFQRERVDREAEQAKESLQDEYDLRIKLAEGDAETQEKLKMQLEEEKAKIDKEAAKKRKKIAITEAIIAGALAVIKALPNPFLVAFAALTTAVNIALISAQQFAKGGKVGNGKKGTVKLSEALYGAPVSRPGIIRGRRNIPTQSNGDDMLITAKRGELILNEEQQRAALSLFGRDVFKKLGIPGFQEGGFVGGIPQITNPTLSGASGGSLAEVTISNDTIRYQAAVIAEETSKKTAERVQAAVLEANKESERQKRLNNNLGE